jgi:transcriptional regulator with XRE-family HTH domain
MITDEVGQRIKTIRNEQGLSQDKLALKAEVDRTYLAVVEMGKRNISLKSLDTVI